MHRPNTNTHRISQVFWTSNWHPNASNIRIKWSRNLSFRQAKSEREERVLTELSSTLHSMPPRKQRRVRAGSFYPTLGRFHLILLHFLPQILSAFVSLASPSPIWCLGACVGRLINASRNLKVFVFVVRVWKICVGDGHHGDTRVVNPKDSAEIS